jgi:hypothetical protein
MPVNGFNLFIRLCVKCKVEIFLIEEFMYGVVVNHTFNCYPGSSCSVQKNCPLTTLLCSLWRLIKLVSDDNTMGGGLLLPVFSFVPHVLVEFLSLPISTFSIVKSLRGQGSYSLLLATGFGELEVDSSDSWCSTF